MKSTIPVLAIYSWILIFINFCSIKPEFRAIDDVHDAWNKYF